ncbi:hypothetical protein NDU88_010646 [Pleurodeles waltl]|uniref:Uncharacterized protein n=1 Tax=Pleurodeles waltl TaxID=8319 RepID=A0AAV7PYI7_PLEWA|nr:hypothetical protein NDU88_010646 [Pleurodeles waltl]
MCWCCHGQPGTGRRRSQSPRISELKGARRATWTSENAEKRGRWVAEKKKSVAEAGVCRTEGGWLKRTPGKSQGKDKGEDRTENVEAEKHDTVMCVPRLVWGTNKGGVAGRRSRN